MHSVEAILQILTFDFSWAQDMQYTLSHDAGRWQRATTLSQSHGLKGKQLTTILYPYILFAFSMVVNTLQEIFNTIKSALC